MSKTIVTSCSKTGMARFTKKKSTCVGCRAVIDRDGREREKEGEGGRKGGRERKGERGRVRGRGREGEGEGVREIGR